MNKTQKLVVRVADWDHVDITKAFDHFKRFSFENQYWRGIAPPNTFELVFTVFNREQAQSISNWFHKNYKEEDINVLLYPPEEEK